jgi:HEAT repeat protein
MATEAADEVFARTLLGEYDDDAPWEAVRELHNLGTREVFDKAAEWCRSAEPLKRARGADVLAQLGRTPDHPANNFPEDSFAIVSLLIEIEEDPMPLSSAIFALGHIGDPRAVAILSRYQNHSDAEVRFALAFALGNFTDDATAVDVLVHLTRDEDEDVRDWSTFGIGARAAFGIGALGEGDSPAVRDALIGRLDDSFEDVRQEAIAGLACLKDERVVPALQLALEQPEVPEIMIEAALHMLGLSESVEAWTPVKCAGELRKRFGR